MYFQFICITIFLIFIVFNVILKHLFLIYLYCVSTIVKINYFALKLIYIAQHLLLAYISRKKLNIARTVAAVEEVPDMFGIFENFRTSMRKDVKPAT